MLCKPNGIPQSQPRSVRQGEQAQDMAEATEASGSQWLRAVCQADKNWGFLENMNMTYD